MATCAGVGTGRESWRLPRAPPSQAGAFPPTAHPPPASRSESCPHVSGWGVLGRPTVSSRGLWTLCHFPDMKVSEGTAGPPAGVKMDVATLEKTQPARPQTRLKGVISVLIGQSIPYGHKQPGARTRYIGSDHSEGAVATGLKLTKDHQPEPPPPTPVPVISPKAEGRVSLWHLESSLSTAWCDGQSEEPALRRDPQQAPRPQRRAVSTASSNAPRAGLPGSSAEPQVGRAGRAGGDSRQSLAETGLERRCQTLSVPTSLCS